MFTWSELTFHKKRKRWKTRGSALSWPCVLYRICSFRFDPLTNMAATGHSCFRLIYLKKSSETDLPKWAEIWWEAPIRNMNCLWWPCLLTDQNGMSNSHREPSINASFHVLVHLAMQFQRRIFLEIDQLETIIACVGYIHLAWLIYGRSSIEIAHFVLIHYQTWPPQ
jgi:hypothetical protein